MPIYSATVPILFCHDSDNILPLKSVVEDGAPAQFVISGSGNLNNDVVVEYTLNSTGDFFDNLGQGTQRIRLTASQPNALIQIATVDDNYAERDGGVTLTLIDGQTYDLTDQSSASVAVTDAADRQL